MHVQFPPTVSQIKKIKDQAERRVKNMASFPQVVKNSLETIDLCNTALSKARGE